MQALPAPLRLLAALSFVAAAACAGGGTGAPAGSTSCPPGQTRCGASCVSLTDNASNCGACGNACAVGASCVSSACTCQPGLSPCDGSCVNLAGDGLHCGSCQSACVGQVCSAGSCQSTCTVAGQTQCGTSCASLLTDPAHCGSCDVACGAAQACMNGACSGAGGAGGSSGSGGSAGNVGSGGSGGSTAGTGGSSAGSGGTGGGGSTVCGSAAEGASVSLMCPDGLLITDVVFASYGTPGGACGSFSAGACSAASSASVVKALCVGKSSCSVSANNGTFGDPCNSTVKSLSVEVSCGTDVVVGTEPFKGVANSPCEARKALNVSWYYNWTQNESEPCNDGAGGTFVPMVWGHTGSEQSAQGISTAVATFVSRGQDHVLGFNEPDNPSQSNIPVGTAMSLLPSFDNPAIQIVSPATAANANPGQAWFTDFMGQLNASSVRVDVLAIHWYGWNAGSCNATASQLESYITWAENFAGGRPIWITEWGCLNQSAPDVSTVVSFYNGALAVFARHPRVERYAWYPWATNCNLNNEDGSLTPLGEAYAAAPAYR